nr:hypothetical protein [uncultured Mediterranean phage uvMED]|tara:strand:+ start:93 stop:266 length:174 start_codon:yes stop_codon:yes gene_type:complete
MTIDLLVKIYNKWGVDNDIESIGSADEELMWNSNLNDKQIKWLEKFIEIWDKLQNKN